MEENIKNSIKIPKTLDEVIINGFQKGKKEKQRIRKNKINTRIVMGASAAIVTLTLIGINNPQLVKGIPIINSAFFGYLS